MTFCTFPRNSNFVSSGIGGRRPKNVDIVARSGSTLYFSASFQNSALSSATFSGFAADTSFAWVKSSGR